MDEARNLAEIIRDDALASRKVAMISGPRQVGKSTLGRSLLEDPGNAYTWDDEGFRRAWSRDPVAALGGRGPGPVLLDEVHKDRLWKRRLKGLYDLRGQDIPMVVTGSARLEVFRRGGDSMMGRYLPYRLHPFSVGEGKTAPEPDAVGERGKVRHAWGDLLRLGGFPEPLLDGSEARARRWSRLRTERLVGEDVRDLRAVHDHHAMRMLVDLLPARVGSLLSVHALREDVGRADGTVRAWLEVLADLYHCFTVRPWRTKLHRSIKAAPKLYLFDILPIADLGARRENLAALHLLKACHLWTDAAHGDFDLHFIRTKDGAEVDFVVSRDRKPWLLVECTSGDTDPDPRLAGFKARLAAPLAFQLVEVAGHDRLWRDAGVRVVEYGRFFSGLP
jgi:predicted AAA+ superfamily ATPase